MHFNKILTFICNTCQGTEKIKVYIIKGYNQVHIMGYKKVIQIVPVLKNISIIISF